MVIMQGSLIFLISIEVLEDQDLSPDVVLYEIKNKQTKNISDTGHRSL